MGEHGTWEAEISEPYDRKISISRPQAEDIDADFLVLINLADALEVALLTDRWRKNESRNPLSTKQFTFITDGEKQAEGNEPEKK